MPTQSEIETALADFAFAARAYQQKLKNLREIGDVLLDQPPKTSKSGETSNKDGELLDPPA